MALSRHPGPRLLLLLPLLLLVLAAGAPATGGTQATKSPLAVPGRPGARPNPPDYALYQVKFTYLGARVVSSLAVVGPGRPTT